MERSVTLTVVLRVDEWLREQAPAPDLADSVRCVWRGDLGAMSVPLPDECYDLVSVNDGSLWLSGPESSSWPRRYPPGSDAVGLRFERAVGPSVFGFAASELRDARVRLDAVLPGPWARDLGERLVAQPDDASRLLELQRAARSLLARARPVDRTSLAVAAALDRGVSAREVAQIAGLSERQVRRRCDAAFGYGPAVLSRILRVQRALRLARSSTGFTLADLALQAGYCDQQHLAHEIRAVFHTTPGQLFASDSYKTTRGRKTSMTV